MRPIKFRAWDNKELKMHKVADLYFFDDGRTGSCGIRVKGKTTDTIFSPDYDLMQFTGIYDKDGKEVYEDDILDADGELIVVQWHYAELWEIQKKPHRKLLGNIYQNGNILCPQPDAPSL